MGRPLAEGFPEGADDVVVTPDAHQAFRAYADQDVDIFRGPCVGTPDDIPVSGPLAEAAPRVERLRAPARERKGWIMDTYRLRRGPAEGRARAPVRRSAGPPVRERRRGLPQRRWPVSPGARRPGGRAAGPSRRRAPPWRVCGAGPGTATGSRAAGRAGVRCVRGRGVCPGRAVRR